MEDLHLPCAMLRLSLRKVANWRLATSAFGRWTTEALHPPFLFFLTFGGRVTLLNQPLFHEYKNLNAVQALPGFSIPGSRADARNA
jgi:hypothetical protein